MEAWFARAVHRITAEPLARYQTAVVRIGVSLTWLLFLLREFPHRQELYGPDGPWSWSIGHRLIEDNGAFTALIWSDSQAWFEIVYALAILSSVLLLLGWHTRAASVLFMVGVLSLENRSIFMSDGGDNVIHLMAIYLVLVRCGSVWSLDARRARRSATARARGLRLRAEAVGPLLWSVLGIALIVVTIEGFISTGWLLVFWGLWTVHCLWWYVNQDGLRDQNGLRDQGGLRGQGGSRGPNNPHGSGESATEFATEPATESVIGSASKTAPKSAPKSAAAAQNEPRLLLDVLANLVHNAGLLVIMVETCLIYSTAGWYKIQGTRWQDGTAVYYPLHLDYFSPWPALSDLLGGHGLVVLLATYGTVMVQVAFPFALFNRRVKNVLLVAMICEHTVIAVTLGLPFFSLAMIAADSVFMPTGFLLWLGTQVARIWSAVLPGGRRTGTARLAGGETGFAGTDTGAGGGETDTGAGGGETDTEEARAHADDSPQPAVRPTTPRQRPADDTSVNPAKSRS
nr:HTTM domain-containing protein [Streptomyces sp. ODS25]